MNKANAYYHPWFDTVIEVRPAVQTFLRQGIRERATFKESHEQLLAVAQQIEQTRQRMENRGIRQQASAPA